MTVNIYFINGNDIDVQNHYYQKEYRDDVIVEIDGVYYEVYFFLSNALNYEMTKDGYFSLPGIIILDEITFDKICISVNHLVDLKYFERFKGSEIGPFLEKFSKNWYSDTLSQSRKDLLTVHKLRE